jgi:YggT family protein
MLFRIVGFILETLFFLLIGAALLRAYMNWLRVNMTSQPGIFVMALTSWLVKPLRRILPAALAKARIDWASLIAALMLALIYGLLWSLLVGALFSVGYWTSGLGPLNLLGFSLRMLVRVALQAMMVIVIAQAIISWVQPGSPIYGMLSRLVDPLLAPLRRFVPTIGGVDLSSLVLVILLQIALMLLT